LHRRRASLRNVDAHKAIAYLRPLLGPERFDAAQADNPMALENLRFVALNDECSMNWAVLGSSAEADETLSMPA